MSTFKDGAIDPTRPDLGAWVDITITDHDIQERPIVKQRTIDGLSFTKMARGVEALLQRVFDHLADTPLGGMITQNIEKSGWIITLDHREDRWPILDVTQKILSLPNDQMRSPALLRSPYFRNRLILSFLQGLRLVERQDAVMMPFFLSPTAWLLWERMRNADSYAVMMALAYDLRTVLPDLWHHACVMEDGTGLVQPVNKSTSSGSELDLYDLFQSWFHMDQVRFASDARALRQIDFLFEQTSDLSRFRRPLTLTAMRHYTEKEVGKSYLPGRLERLTLRDLDPIHAAYLAQLEREQHTVTHGAISMRDRDLAARLFE